jgi:Ca2+-binding EF-hand superfamily protein
MTIAFLSNFQVIHDLHSGILPAEDRITPEELTDHIFKRADQNHDGKVDRQAFLHVSIEISTPVKPQHLHKMAGPPESLNQIPCHASL